MTTPADAPDELAAAREEIARLKDALRAAILSTHRAIYRCVEPDPAGSVYEIRWLPKVREWAALCGLDLDRVDPSGYAR